jgi:uncharacterized protein YgbK (DUF1537 family)
MHKVFIVADDLTGAADCGVAFASHGLSTLLTFGNTAPSTTTDAIAIVGDTRRLSAQEAAHRSASIVQRITYSDGQYLFKKIDSTLRGHAAAELAAILHARRAATSTQTIIVLAPAFPAHGRTTLHGHQMLYGRHLHETEFGQREQMAGRCDLVAMMHAAGLTAAVIPLDRIRSGKIELRSDLHRLASKADVLICDAETDTDLQSIAVSAITLGPSTLWAGSAGLAHHLPLAAGLSRPTQPIALPPLSKPILFVIGSTSTSTRNQLKHLLAGSSVVAVTISPRSLLEGALKPAWQRASANISRALVSGRDTAVIVNDEILLSKQDAPKIALALGDLLATLHHAVGALVATGGETARAVLEAWGISALLLHRDLEPGLPLSVTEGWSRPLPVITKAGAFGHIATLSNCLQTLHNLAPIQSGSQQ